MGNVILIMTLVSYIVTECLGVYCVSSQLFDCATLDHIKTFKTERPVNSAAISPIMDHVSEDSHCYVCKNERWRPCTHLFAT